MTYTCVCELCQKFVGMVHWMVNTHTKTTPTFKHLDFYKLKHLESHRVSLQDDEKQHD